MKITRHKTVMASYAVVSSGGRGTGYFNDGEGHGVEQIIDRGIERALDILGGEYMTNTVMIQSVSTSPIPLVDGTVFLAITVIATLEPNKMKDMRFVKSIHQAEVI